MKLNNLFLTPLGASAPIGVNQKNEAVTALAAVAGVTALLGSIIGASSQDSANATNLQGIRETNEANARINQSQLDFARQQYYLERNENRFLVDQQYQRDLDNRDYNSPAQLVARLRAAGINPALALTGGGASLGSSNVSSSTGQNASGNVPNAIPMQSGNVQPIDYSGLGVGVNNMAQIHLAAEKNQADMSAMKQHTDNETLETLGKIRNHEFNNAYLRQQMNKVVQDIAFNRENWSARSYALELANSKIESDISYQKALTSHQEFINKVAPELHDLEKKQLAAAIEASAADAAMKYSAKELNDQQTLTEIEKTAQEKLAKLNLPKKFHNENAVLTATHKEIIQRAKKLKAETSTEKWRTIDVMKHSMKPSDRPLSDYLNYARDAFENVDMNNKRGFYRMR